VKRYLVFTYPIYYPGGGWSDFIDDFDNIADAFACADESSHPNKEVIDTETKNDVYLYQEQRPES
jgi:hypothetical protein